MPGALCFVLRESIQSESTDGGRKRLESWRAPRLENTYEAAAIRGARRARHLNAPQRRFSAVRYLSGDEYRFHLLIHF
jgi:hypothetical protein